MNICTIFLFFFISLFSIEPLLEQEGSASYYGTKFHGRPTASGERYNMHQLTAAHKTLPFNTLVEVTNLRNNKKVIVRINDRMPTRTSKVIDMSRAAALQIDMVRNGIGHVKVRQLPAEGETPELPAEAPKDTVIAGVGSMG